MNILRSRCGIAESHAAGRKISLVLLRSNNCLYTGLPSTREHATQASAAGERPTQLAHAICNLLRRGGKWDSLTEKFSSVALSDETVEKVLLLHLEKPTHARKALVFFHWCSHHRNLRHGQRSWSLMVHILVHAGLLTDATALLHSAVRKTDSSEAAAAVVQDIRSTYRRLSMAPPGGAQAQVYDLLVLSFARLKKFHSAFEACRILEQEDGFLPTLGTFNSLLRMMERAGEFDMVWKVYEYMVAKRKYPNQPTMEIVVGSMCKEGTLTTVLAKLDRIMHDGRRRWKRSSCSRSPNVVVGAALALRIIEEDRSEEAILLMKRMVQKNLMLDNVADSLIVFAHCKMCDLESARKAFEEMGKRGHPSNSFVYTSLIAGYCAQKRMDDANHLMEEMLQEGGLQPYDETYNALILWSSRTGRPNEALDFCTNMLAGGLLPSCVACNEMIRKLCEDGEVEKANMFFTVLLDKGFLPDETTYAKLIDGYGKVGNVNGIMKLYYEMEGRGPPPGISAYTSLISGLRHCGKLEEAEKMGSSMKVKSIATVEYVDSLLASEI